MTLHAELVQELQESNARTMQELLDSPAYMRGKASFNGAVDRLRKKVKDFCESQRYPVDALEVQVDIDFVAHTSSPDAEYMAFEMGLEHRCKDEGLSLSRFRRMPGGRAASWCLKWRGRVNAGFQFLPDDADL